MCKNLLSMLLQGVEGDCIVLELQEISENEYA